MMNIIFESITPDFMIYLLDMVGVVACAIAGTTLALHKKFDFFLSIGANSKKGLRSTN